MKILIYSLIALLGQSVPADICGLTVVAFDIESTGFSTADNAITANETYYIEGTRR